MNANAVIAYLKAKQLKRCSEHEYPHKQSSTTELKCLCNVFWYTEDSCLHLSYETS